MQHPLPTAPGALLGYRKNGQPIYLAAGGDENGQPAAGDPAPATGTDTGQGTQDGGQAPPTTSPAQGTGQQPAKGDVSSLPDWAQKELRDARAEAGKARTTAKQNAADQARKDLTREIGKALGLVEDDTPPDPAKLTEQVTSLQATNRTTAVELAIWKQAGAHGADPAALADSRSFMDAVAGLDPAADDFGDKVGAAIKTAVENNPALTGQAATAPRSGGEFPGSPSAPTSLDQQISTAEKNGNHREAIRLKRLRAAQT